MDSNVVDAIFCEVTWEDVLRDMSFAGRDISLPKDALIGVHRMLMQLPDATEEERRAVAECVEALILIEKKIARTCSQIGGRHGNKTAHFDS